jgi:hypothetical protein
LYCTTTVQRQYNKMVRKKVLEQAQVFGTTITLDMYEQSLITQVIEQIFKETGNRPTRNDIHKMARHDFYCKKLGENEVHKCQMAKT